MTIIYEAKGKLHVVFEKDKKAAEAIKNFLKRLGYSGVKIYE